MIFYIISIICAIFLNSSFAVVFGVSTITSVAFGPMVSLILKDIFLKKIRFYRNTNRYATKLIIYSIIIISIKFLIGQNYFKYMLTLIIIPMLIHMYLANVSKIKINILRSILDVFFVFNCLLAVYERFFKVNVFYVPPEELEYTLSIAQDWEFRSHALLGHPLANAMVVAVIMTFVMISNSSNLKKYFFIILGVASLFCFNARGATYVTFLFIIPYFFIQQYKKQKIRNKLVFILFFCTTITFFLYTVLNSSFGGRLVNSGKFIDGSAQTRLAVFQFYNYLSNVDLFWGNNDSYLYLTDKLGAGGVENGIIVLVINLGLIFTPTLLYFLFRFQLNLLKEYKKAERWLIIAVFYLIGIMNPNLATPIQWIIFIFSFYAYRKITKSQTSLRSNYY